MSNRISVGTFSDQPSLRTLPARALWLTAPHQADALTFVELVELPALHFDERTTPGRHRRE
jgi:hypothetical protein